MSEKRISFVPSQAIKEQPGVVIGTMQCFAAQKRIRWLKACSQQAHHQQSYKVILLSEIVI